MSAVYAFLELPKLPRRKPDTGALQWAWLFVHAPELTEIPADLPPGPYREALALANEATFTPAEFEAYRKVMDEIQQAREYGATQRAEGVAEGEVTNGIDDELVSFSRPAAYFASTRSCTSRHHPMAPRVFSLLTGTEPGGPGARTTLRSTSGESIGTRPSSRPARVRVRGSMHHGRAVRRLPCDTRGFAALPCGVRPRLDRTTKGKAEGVAEHPRHQGKPAFFLTCLPDISGTPPPKKTCSAVSILPNLTRRLYEQPLAPEAPQQRNTTMKVMVIVKATKNSEAGVMPSETLLTEMGKYNEELVKAGIMLAGEGLHPSVKGKRIKFSGGKRSVIDGPFTEAKELIAGYWVWQVRSMEEAVAWARRCPDPMPGEDAEIEIRPIFEADDFGKEFTPELRAQEERLRLQVERQKNQA